MCAAILGFLNPVELANLAQVSQASVRAVEEFRRLDDTRIYEQDCKDRFQRRYCAIRSMASNAASSINWTFYLTSIFLELTARNIGAIQNKIYIEPYNLSSVPSARIQYLYHAYAFVELAHVDYSNPSQVNMWNRYAAYCAKLVETSIRAAERHAITIDIDDWFQKMRELNIAEQLGDAVWKVSITHRPAFVYYGIKRCRPF